MPGNVISLTPEVPVPSGDLRDILLTLLPIALQVIASWPPSNYIDPPTRKWMPEYAGILFAFATLMVAMRMFLRATNQGGQAGLDDGFLISAWLVGLMFTTVAIIGPVKYDIGRHTWDIPLLQFTKVAEVTWLGEFSFLLGGGLTKISVLLFYRRLAKGTFNPQWEWAIILAIGFTAAYTLAFILALIFNCHPTEAYWRSFDPSWELVHDYSCSDTTVINLLSGICSALSDLYSVLLPYLVTRRITVLLPAKQRIALNSIFSLGLLVVAASGVRTYYSYQSGTNADVSSMIFNTFVWAQLELQLGLICASAPSLRVFFRQYVSKPLRERRSPESSWDRRHRHSGIQEVSIGQPGTWNAPSHDSVSEREARRFGDEKAVAQMELNPLPRSSSFDPEPSKIEPTEPYVMEPYSHVGPNA